METSEIINEVELLEEEPSLRDIWKLLKSNGEGYAVEVRNLKASTEQKSAETDNRLSNNETQLQNIATEVTTQSSQLNAMQQRLDQLETTSTDRNYEYELEKQRHLKNNITIMGILAKDNKDLKKMVLNVFACVGVKVSPSSLLSVYRRSGMVVAKLCNYEDKTQIIMNKMKRKLCAKDADGRFSSDVPIFINNHTTPYFGRILQFGRNATRDKRIHSIRLTTKGCVMKQTTDGDEVVVKSVSHFISLLDMTLGPTTSTTPAETRSKNDQRSTKTQNSTQQKDGKQKNNKRAKQSGSKRRNRSFESVSPNQTEGMKQKNKSSKMDCDDDVQIVVN